jgi:rubrerythrin
MSKTLIPENLKGKDLYKFLVENKQQLIREKKSLIKRTEPLQFDPSIIMPAAKTVAKKDNGETEETFIPDADTVRVKVVANTANWIDSQLDMLIDDCWKASIKNRKGMIPHLHDHYQCIEGKIGEVASIYSQDMKLSELGINKSGTTQVLVFETDVMKSYNEKVYNQYKLKKINQHSIGLQYVNISLCINDEDSEKEFDFWNKYYPLVINKDMADEYGFFWVVSEIKLLENSCVLFGANELTPTLEVQDSSNQPAKSTDHYPLNSDTKSMVICKNCQTMFDTQSNSAKCPNCGQYVSSQSTSAEGDSFDLLSAINETTFINY